MAQDITLTQTGAQLQEILDSIPDKEVKTNKVTSISSQSTDTEYPSAKCVYGIVGNIESALESIIGN